MIRIALRAAALLVVASVTPPTFAAPKVVAASAADAETTVKALYAGFAAGDMPKILSLIAPEVVWTYHAPFALLPFAGTYKGREGVGAFFAADAKYVEVKSNDVNSFVSSGDKVVVFGAEHGVIRANGKSFVAPWVHAFTVKGGQITEFEEYIDSASIYHALAQ